MHEIGLVLMFECAQWCESQRQCGRLKLSDLLVKPWQRLTRYKLLLYAMRTPLDKMDSSDPTVDDHISAIDAAVSIQSDFMSVQRLVFFHLSR